MQNAQHTPGPWRYLVEAFDDSWAIIVDKAGGIVANVNSETGPDANSAPAMRQMPMRANGHLIVAAPDMLAALELVYANAAESPEWIRERIVPAIAKAKAV